MNQNEEIAAVRALGSQRGADDREHAASKIPRPPTATAVPHTPPARAATPSAAFDAAPPTAVNPNRKNRPWSARTNGSTLSQYGVKTRNSSTDLLGGSVRTDGTPVGKRTLSGSGGGSRPCTAARATGVSSGGVTATTSGSRNEYRHHPADDSWRPESTIRTWQEGVTGETWTPSTPRPTTSRAVSALRTNYLKRNDKASKAFVTSFHLPRNQELVKEQYQRLSINTSEAAALRQEQADTTTTGRQSSAGRSRDGEVTARSTKSSASTRRDASQQQSSNQKMNFRTAWRVARNSDLKLKYSQGGGLSLHQEPFVPPAEIARLRTSDEDQTAIFSAAALAGDLRTLKRPETPRSVAEFFGDGEDYVDQDKQYSQQFKSRLMRVAAKTVASRPPSTRPRSTMSMQRSTSRAEGERSASPTAAAAEANVARPGTAMAASSARPRPKKQQRHATAIKFADDPRDVAAWVRHVRASSSLGQAADH